MGHKTNLNQWKHLTKLDTYDGSLVPGGTKRVDELRTQQVGRANDAAKMARPKMYESGLFCTSYTVRKLFGPGFPT